MSDNDEGLRTRLLNHDFANALIHKLNDPFLQVRYNSVMAIMNILISYGNFDADILLIKECKMFLHIERYIKEVNTNYLKVHIQSKYEYHLF